MSNQNKYKPLFRFQSAKEKKEFLQERLADGHKFREKFEILFIGFGVVFLIGDILFLQEGSISLSYYLIRLAGVIGGLFLYCLSSRIKFCSRQFKKLNSLSYDSFYLLIWMVLTVVLGGITLIRIDSTFDASGVSGYFSAANLWLPLFFAFFFFKSFIVYWIHKVIYLTFIVVGFLGFRISHAPVGSSIFLEAGVGVLIGIIIILDEWSHRIAFMNKKKSREKIELFQATLDRIQEFIIVVNEKMEIKYSNLTQSKFPRDNAEGSMSVRSISEAGLITETLAKPSESLLKSITSLRFSDASVFKERIPQKIRNSLAAVHEGYTLSDWLQAIWIDEQLSEEFNEQRFITLEGKVHKENDALEATEATEGSGELFFTIQLFAKSYDNQKCLVVILKDITEHVVILQERYEMQSNLLSSLSHELNTPLGISQTLVENAVGDGECTTHIASTYLEPALNYTRLLKLFISDVLDFVKIQKHDFQLDVKVVCVEKVLEELVNLFDSSLKIKELTLRLDYDTTGCTILKTDPNRLKQVVNNLLSNAIKYTERGGISLSMLPKADGSGCIIKVSDTGIGISQKELLILRNKLSKSNFCTIVNKNTTGAGVGLIISHAITKRLNPSRGYGLHVESDPEIGTTFTMEVENQVYEEPELLLRNSLKIGSEPFLDEDVVESLQALTPFSQQVRSSFIVLKNGNSSAQKLHGNPYKTSSDEVAMFDQIELKYNERCKCRRILIVDDEVFNTVAAEMVGRSLGYTTESAFNGRHALEKIEKRVQEKCGHHCKLYDLVVMDCNMPVMDGYMATEIIREKIRKGALPKLAIAGCTAYEGIDKLEQCIKSGMDTYVKKPLDKGKLQALLKQLGR